MKLNCGCRFFLFRLLTFAFVYWLLRLSLSLPFYRQQSPHILTILLQHMLFLTENAPISGRTHTIPVLLAGGFFFTFVCVALSATQYLHAFWDKWTRKMALLKNKLDFCSSYGIMAGVQTHKQFCVHFNGDFIASWVHWKPAQVEI